MNKKEIRFISITFSLLGVFVMCCLVYAIQHRPSNTLETTILTTAENEIVETVELTEYIIETTTETTTEEVTTTEPKQMYYTVNNAFIGYDLSDYLYDELKKHNIEWFFEIALCQLYQESRYNSNAKGYDGYDQGIAQLRVVYWDYFKQLSGISNADPFNPYDSISIYACLMAKNLKATNNDIKLALSTYNTGNKYNYNADYVKHILGWKNTLAEKI